MTDMRVEEVVLPVIPASLPSPAPDSPLEALSWLGDTAEEVAEGLRARGIKGRHRDHESCPVAAYLHMWWSDVGVGTTVYHAVNGPASEMMETGDLPVVIGAFVVQFDSGAFPDLIDNG